MTSLDGEGPVVVERMVVCCCCNLAETGSIGSSRKVSVVNVISGSEQRAFTHPHSINIVCNLSRDNLSYYYHSPKRDTLTALPQPSQTSKKTITKYRQHV